MLYTKNEAMVDHLAAVGYDMAALRGTRSGESAPRLNNKSEVGMGDAGSFGAAWAPRVLSVLRVISGFLFMAHGMEKLFAFPVPFGMGQPPLFSLLGVAGVLEVGGGALLLVGLFTRPVAFVLSGFMAVAYFMAQAAQGFWPIGNKGE